jgi:outer membrane protein assembly factor BamA
MNILFMGQNIPSKLTIIFVLLIVLYGCRSAKEIAGDRYLLEKNIVYKNQKELTNDPVKLLLVDKPNKKILGYPLKMQLYSLASPDPEADFNRWLHKKPKRLNRLQGWLSPKQVKELGKIKTGFNRWLKETGEAPIFVDSSTLKKNKNRLEQFYKNQGYFDTRVRVEQKPLPDSKAIVSYFVETQEPYKIDSISKKIRALELEELYDRSQKNSLIQTGNPFEIDQFEAERIRLINYFRNNGVYNFQQNSLQFTAAIDSSGRDKKIPVVVEINNLQKRENDSIIELPYKIHNVAKINLYIDTPGQLGQLSSYTDSLDYKDFTFYFKGKLKYKPKALEEVIFVKKDQPYSDYDRALTYRYISNLKNFKYPSITFSPIDEKTTDLAAYIFLSPKERFSMGFDLDLSHSNIQEFGVSLGTSFGIRNIFRGAEILEISVKNTLGASSDIVTINRELFNLYELGADVKLRFPRIFSPIDAERWIPKTMNPSTDINFSATLQQNIGLDKHYFGAGYQLNWEPNTMAKLNLKLIDLEFINNQNTGNYFNVYRNSYDKLNKIAQNFNTNLQNINSDGDLKIPVGANQFISEVLSNQTPLSPEDSQYQEVNLIHERQTRLTTNNLILGSSLGINYNSQQSIIDESFFQIKWKLSWVGSLLNSLIKARGGQKNENDQYEIAGVTPSQFVKTEMNYIKHWELSPQTVLAFRAFGGIAVPMGNANSIPFTRSYFSGGANDNRGWRAYELGPGSSSSLNEFNEANFKLSFNLEYRFPLFGAMNGALFMDAGNIWNVLDNVKDPAYRFEGFGDLSEIALGTGFGLRYDFDFFVFRLDTGFKTYNPALPLSYRWKTQYSIKDAVFNIGINYPF